MNQKEFMIRTSQRFQNRMKLCDKKSKDYATQDVLSNFKRVGSALEVLRVWDLPLPLAYGFTLIILKLDRWINLLLQDTTPKNESLDDTVQDLENYIDLTDATVQDMKGDKN